MHIYVPWLILKYNICYVICLVTSDFLLMHIFIPNSVHDSNTHTDSYHCLLFNLHEDTIYADLNVIFMRLHSVNQPLGKQGLTFHSFNCFNLYALCTCDYLPLFLVHFFSSTPSVVPSWCLVSSSFQCGIMTVSGAMLSLGRLRCRWTALTLTQAKRSMWRSEER